MTLLACPCGCNRFKDIFSYTEPPKVEVSYDFVKSEGEYRRYLRQCEICGHFISEHKMDTVSLYDGDYVSSNYGELGILDTFNRIISLPAERSDNNKRVNRVIDFADKFLSSDSRKVLDVGSGLCVFLYRMKVAGWDCTALDPDQRQVHHAKNNVGVNAVHGDFLTVDNLGKFDVITINRVLEHVKDPISMLARTKDFVKENGLIYLELPDGETAIQDSPVREEFTIDHYHVFSFCSVSLLISKAGLRPVRIERCTEPSGKYSILAFCSTVQ